MSRLSEGQSEAASSAIEAIVSCAVCGAPANQALEIEGFDIFECRQCGHRMIPPVTDASHVERIYDDDYFFGGGAGYPDYLMDRDLLLRRGRWYARLVGRHCESPGRMLDVGAAAGFTLQAFTGMGWEGVGLEPNDTMAGHGREELGLDVRTGTLEELEPTGPFDLVCLFQVISHLIDPRSALKRVADVLKPGGLVLIETWNWHSLTARAFGERWHQYSPPSVVHWFCDHSLERLMTDSGLARLATGRAWKRISWAHARSLLVHKLGEGLVGGAFQRLSRVAPRRLALPYLFDDARWYLYRVKSPSP